MIPSTDTYTVEIELLASIAFEIIRLFDITCRLYPETDTSSTLSDVIDGVDRLRVY